jgi:hypothetical protein
MAALAAAFGEIGEIRRPSTASSDAERVRGALLAEVEGPARHAPFAGRVAELFGIEEAAAAALLDDLVSPTRWSDGPVPGFSYAAVPRPLLGGKRGAGDSCTFLRGAAGAEFPMHRHLGRETVLVLEGGYRDLVEGRDVETGARDEHEAGTSHRFVIDASGPCICAIRVLGGIEVLA